MDGNTVLKVTRFGFQKHYLYLYTHFPRAIKNTIEFIRSTAVVMYVSLLSSINKSIIHCPQVKHELGLISLQICSVCLNCMTL